MSRKFTYLLLNTMVYRSAKGLTGWAQLGILIAFIGIGLVIAVIVQVMMVLPLTDPSLPFTERMLSMEKVMMDPKNSFQLQLMQAVSTLVLMFIPAYFWSRVCNGKESLWLGFSSKINLWQVLIVVVVMLAASVCASGLAEATKHVFSYFPRANSWALAKENAYNNLALAISSIKPTWGAFFMGLVIMAFLPAMFEEILFRGALQNLLVRWTKAPILSIIITALVFSLVHGTVYSFLSRALLGFALGWLYYRSKNIWVNILAHFFNNGIVVLQLFLIARSNEKLDLEKMDQPMPLGIELVALAALYGAFVLFDRVSAKKRAAIEADEENLWAKKKAEHNWTTNQN